MPVSAAVQCSVRVSTCLSACVSEWVSVSFCVWLACDLLCCALPVSFYCPLTALYVRQQRWSMLLLLLLLAAVRGRVRSNRSARTAVTATQTACSPLRSHESAKLVSFSSSAGGTNAAADRWMVSLSACLLLRPVVRPSFGGQSPPQTHGLARTVHQEREIRQRTKPRVPAGPMHRSATAAYTALHIASSSQAYTTRIARCA